MSIETETESALKGILETAVQTKDFVLEQAPDVIHQLLMYTVAESILTIAAFLLVSFISYKAVFKWSCQELEYDGSWRIGKATCAAAGGLASFIFFILFLEALSVLTKVLIAPKLFILEYAARLVS